MANTAVIYISPPDKAIHWYSLAEGRIIHDTRNFKSLAFDGEFYPAFTEAITEFSGKYSPASAANTTVVLPDTVVFTDTLSFPLMKAAQLKSAVQMSLAGSYKNQSDLKINTFPVMQSRQTSTFCAVGVRSEIPAALRNACTAARLVARNVTFAAGAAAHALVSLNQKLKGKTFLFLDVKSRMTRYVYVFRGRAVAFLTMPFGFSALDPDRTAAEDVLLYHSVAELAVLNARERAKAKQLTMMGGDNPETKEPSEDGEESFSGTDSLASGRVIETAKVLPRKVARKLPKFMQRDPPEPGEDTILENFRLFVKWSLCFLEGNGRLTALGAPAFVAVNLPKQYGFLFDRVNEEEAGNGVRFVTAGLEGEGEEISRNLEMYGGLYAHRAGRESSF